MAFNGAGWVSTGCSTLPLARSASFFSASSNRSSSNDFSQQWPQHPFCPQQITFEPNASVKSCQSPSTLCCYD
ncbi:hypothetical protein BV22DRAFT_212694 [Leucogyrophana mollusca]|uniref:Uncharacterized protein n=1 Tax=Leucogyrophana mollusca TaxID=85980 RepID=A0ACB8BRM4_9AGAM|nr:hypothetical protein BV22DRAFT_212694 [Leucogyrophana mollusca]